MTRGSSKKKSGQKAKGFSEMTLTKIVEFLLAIIDSEKRAEVVKQMLAEHEEFTPSSLFYRLDQTRKGSINIDDLNQFLAINGCSQLKSAEINLIFGKFDREMNGYLNKLQFQNAVLPITNPKIRFFATRRPIIIPKAGERLNGKIEWTFSKLCTTILSANEELIKLKTSLLSTFDFDADMMFGLVGENGVITIHTLNNFFKKQGIEVENEQLGMLLRFFDQSGAGCATKNSFRHFLGTLGLRKEHEIFDELSPVPALLKSSPKTYKVDQREQTLKERLKDNKSYKQPFNSQNSSPSRMKFTC